MPQPNELNRVRIAGASIAAVFLALLAAIVLSTAGPADAVPAASSSQWQKCRKVVVQFQPEGSGGAIRIKARNVGCSKTRRIVRRCIKGSLAPGWRARFADNRYILSKGWRRIRFLPVGGGGCLPFSMVRVGGLPARPKPPRGAVRISSHRVNLDRDRAKERVLTYNVPDAAFTASWFDVWNQRHNGWKLIQRKLVTNGMIPGGQSGLIRSWVGDLNRDGRVEIASRNLITASVGEFLGIYRQTGGNSLKFAKLQSMSGDQAVVKRRKARAATIRVFFKSNHSWDNREHTELWKWSRAAGRWKCVSDCAPWN